mmetsp:Transcript_13505/g.20472  ORF Transcript_13505/g.20472 Transcript_13505/m.20472 type:complete len:193 (+) Transcript_13505:39-617(+)|eukprot:CAMPEP_0118679756 /NCGR_PEP_ID=MMETSP0800-20121206/3962_1 /TAXON_ID=210618 ORGANISM="Striatella unipunctata, Strain CCMP2910" /NCGR_SAMPLE_ID=MMETSP0800 /ASSEMBLY_ACC=CAM_ASM_000638 /LENGTH=192 /DNA_ID=CAMNT_0006575781 /DNA_START=23 /DNA_END=601 /DNA_ORIENTATION=-
MNTLNTSNSGITPGNGMIFQKHWSTDYYPRSSPTNKRASPGTNKFSLPSFQLTTNVYKFEMNTSNSTPRVDEPRRLFRRVHHQQRRNATSAVASSQVIRTLCLEMEKERLMTNNEDGGVPLTSFKRMRDDSLDAEDVGRMFSTHRGVKRRSTVGSVLSSSLRAMVLDLEPFVSDSEDNGCEENDKKNKEQQR